MKCFWLLILFVAAFSSGKDYQLEDSFRQYADLMDSVDKTTGIPLQITNYTSQPFNLWWEVQQSDFEQFTVSLMTDGNVKGVSIAKLSSDGEMFAVSPLNDTSIWVGNFDGTNQGFYDLAILQETAYGLAMAINSTPELFATGTLLTFTLTGCFAGDCIYIDDLPSLSITSHITTQDDCEHSFSEFNAETICILPTGSILHEVIFIAGEHGTITYGDATQEIEDGYSAIAPSITANSGWAFVGWDTDFSCITDDLIINALYEPLAGEGTTENPYQISTKQHLQAINNDLSANYILINDIDLSNTIYDKSVIAHNTGTDWQFVGTAFSGSFNGNGYQINNLEIDTQNSGAVYIGLFGCIGSSGLVKNLGISSTINLSSISEDVGVICGCNQGLISNCFTAGSITGGEEDLGGICGWNKGEIRNSHSQVSIYSKIDSYAVGGLVGYNSTASTIVNCYSIGYVSEGDLSGGLVGENYSAVENSFWDMDTSEQTTSSGGEGKSTAQMQTKDTFLSAGWDFVNEDVNGQWEVWYMPDGEYPQLYWQAKKGDINYDGLSDINDLDILALEWLTLPQDNRRIIADINLDGAVDLLDFIALAKQWLIE